MIKDITFGQFFPGTSVIHRMDARVKIVLSIALLVLVFVSNTFFSLAFTVALISAFVLLSRIPLKMILKSLKPIIPVIIFTAVLNVFNVGGDVLVRFWILKITAQGIRAAVFVAVRLVCLIAGSSLLTYTTSPTLLTDAIERLLSPLNIIRVDVHTIAMMMTIALRFIPTLVEEVDKIMNAQKARGVDLESGNMLRRMKAMIPILIPLFASSFRRAYDLADAMECRCYHGGKGRTRMKEMHMQKLDFVSIFVMLISCGIVVALNLIG